MIFTYWTEPKWISGKISAGRDPHAGDCGSLGLASDQGMHSGTGSNRVSTGAVEFL